MQYTINHDHVRLNLNTKHTILIDLDLLNSNGLIIKSRYSYGGLHSTSIVALPIRYSVRVLVSLLLHAINVPLRSDVRVTDRMDEVHGVSPLGGTLDATNGLHVTL